MTEVIAFSIINIELTTQDKEYSWQLPKNLKKFTLHVRDGTAIRLAMVADKVAGSNSPYFTLKANTAWSEDHLDIQSDDVFLYMACGSAGKIVEILVGMGREQWQ